MPATIYSNLILSAITVFGLVYTMWIIHLWLKDSSIIDLIWGAGFGLVASLLLYMAPVKTPFLILLAALPIIWAIRYTVFIFKRNVRHGEDDRYTLLREKVKKKGIPWPLFSFVMVYGFQALSMLLVCTPLVIGLAASEDIVIGLLPGLGAALWLLGFFMEAIADIQLNTFKAKHKNYNGPYEKKPLLDTGLWKYSRHPNYFGNACMWWGIGIIALAAPFGWVGLIGPVYMNIALVFITGKANNESKMMGRKSYLDYMKRTSGFFPLPPKRVASEIVGQG